MKRSSSIVKLKVTGLYLMVMLLGLVAQEILSNDAIVKLVKAGMSEETVLNMVRTQPAKFDVSVDALLTLKTSGVNDKIINAMILRGQAPSGAAASASSIPAKTPVRLLVDELLSSGTSKAGQTFRLVTADDVMLNGRVVIAKGAAATGRVSSIKRKTFANSNGQIEIVIDSVQSADGQTVPLEARVTEGGGGVGFGRIGRDAKIEKGYVINAVVQ